MADRVHADLLREYRELRARALGSGDARLVLFVDLVGSTAYKEQFGPLEGALRSEYHNSIVGDIATDYGLDRVKSLGDGIMLQKPVQTGVDIGTLALDFAAACLNSPAQSLLNDQPPLQSRIGAALGKVVELPDGDLLGAPVDLAARLQSAAKPGQALADSSVFSGGVAPRRLRWSSLSLPGLQRPIRAYELTAPRMRAQGVPVLERWSGYRFVVTVHPMVGYDPGVRERWLRAVVDLSYTGVLRTRRLQFVAVEPGQAFAEALADPDVFSCFSVPLAMASNRRLVDEVFRVKRVRVAGVECVPRESQFEDCGAVISRRFWQVPRSAGVVGDLAEISYLVDMVTRRAQPFFSMVSEQTLIDPVYALHLGGIDRAQLSFAPHFPPGTRHEVTYHPTQDEPTGIEVRVHGTVPPGAGVTFMWGEPSASAVQAPWTNVSS